MSRRPEHLAPPEVFYNESEARKYTQSSRMIEIQEQMCERAIELLLLPEDRTSLVLDIGCGSGLSGTVLGENGHVWIGIDIAPAMLGIALERETEGDLILGDMGQGMPFRAGTFDGAISISALQWLCNADKSSHNPSKRLYKFFSTLFSCLSRSARAVFQFYPENNEQIELVTTQATKAGFYGGVVVDFPNSTKAKKFFLVLMTGGPAALPQALGVSDADAAISYIARREQIKKARGKPLKKSRDWITEKKERRRKQGKKVPEDSKYTGRRRCGRF
ncbi:probable 18S rRNA (guanine-N(7))-methyltransferase [Hylaeus anthracinus]|uniref:probable 18S rRNA (guanine-N(7))-methyltransferase n=1 Tax=Hylaeus volcanicus TaxID=313075 RepID=UPI0023B87442|nr:probable 18S rRNA (guanine-N(7))-methyltransferase [Hylaeus volcanicus]XP_053988861.1 probable 18S rRNA (guanine-N(7))-methyltransferase [Hylaeus volcanicus]XP_054008622.1 probable 18S rRNA (guanine-N(7))-methyltransferase [Hylaeus anthracinus]XP_054008623.1 probable 18S rRNA (guanine-N(7))-methyltransferase [Hylaeus anthracinus]